MAYHSDKAALTDDGAISDFSDADKSTSFKYKQKTTGVTEDDDIKNLENNGAIKILK